MMYDDWYDDDDDDDGVDVTWWYIFSSFAYEDLSGVTKHSTLYRTIVKYAMVLQKSVQNVYQWVLEVTLDRI